MIGFLKQLYNAKGRLSIAGGGPRRAKKLSKGQEFCGNALLLVENRVYSMQKGKKANPSKGGDAKLSVYAGHPVGSTGRTLKQGAVFFIFFCREGGAA